MKLKILFFIGRKIELLGKWLMKPGEKLEDYGRDLWVANCLCHFCQKRREAR